jgi:hypothetical protein
MTKLYPGKLFSLATVILFTIGAVATIPSTGNCFTFDRDDEVSSRAAHIEKDAKRILPAFLKRAKSITGTLRPALYINNEETAGPEDILYYIRLSVCMETSSVKDIYALKQIRESGGRTVVYAEGIRITPEGTYKHDMRHYIVISTDEGVKEVNVAPQKVWEEVVAYFFELEH